MLQFPISFYYKEASSEYEDFTATFDTTKAGSASDTLVLPYAGGNTTYWGDGSDSTSNTHTYDTGGTYLVHVEGAVSLRFNEGGDCLKLIDVKSWDTLSVTAHSAFGGCLNMTVSATNAPSMNTCEKMFNKCESILNIDFTNWDTSGVSNFASFLADCDGLTSLDVSALDMSSATSISSMFTRCHGLTSLDTTGWDTSSVTSMYGVFKDCNGTFTDMDFTDWDFNAVTNMGDFLKNTAMSTTDYSNMLIEMDSQTVQSSVTLNGGNSKYNTNGGTARASLISSDSWSISDGGAE